MLAATLALGASGQHTKARAQRATKPANGTIVVYRQWAFAGSLQRYFKFSIDNRPEIGVLNGYYVRVTVAPGDHIISRDIFMMPPNPQTVHVEPGQTVYFQHNMVPGWSIFEVADDQAKAAQTVAHMKAMN